MFKARGSRPLESIPNGRRAIVAAYRVSPVNCRVVKETEIIVYGRACARARVFLSGALIVFQLYEMSPRSRSESPILVGTWCVCTIVLEPIHRRFCGVSHRFSENYQRSDLSMPASKSSDKLLSLEILAVDLRAEFSFIFDSVIFPGPNAISVNFRRERKYHKRNY